MTEEEWLTATDPVSMLRYLREKATNRQMRLFLVACARLVWDRVPDVGEMKEAVEVAECYADGSGTAELLGEFRRRFYGYLMRGATPEQREWVRNSDKTPIFTLVRMTVYTDQMLHSLPANENWRDIIRSYHPKFPGILRDVFGNPFRPATLNPSHVTPTVTALARQMYDTQDFTAMPILADALEDAGCQDAEVLRHCREGTVHSKGCWV